MAQMTEAEIDAEVEAILAGKYRPIYMVMAYYNRLSDACGAGGSELYSTADTEDEAIEDARTASARDAGKTHPHEYAVEGGHYENGSWENPLFRAGKRIR